MLPGVVQAANDHGLRCDRLVAFDSHRAVLTLMNGERWRLRFVDVGAEVLQSDQQLCFHQCFETADRACVGPLYSADGQWLQQQWVLDGKALVYSATSWRFKAPKEFEQLWTAERKAESLGLGQWQRMPLNANNLPQLPTGQLFELVGREVVLEGRVASTSRYGGQRYVNFGTDWREDTTAVLAVGVTRRKIAEGQRLRIRGLLDLYSGPRFQISQPQQIEFLDDGD